MTSDSGENSPLPTAQAYAERHKKAFRAAFDFLNSHFPPTTDPDWWSEAALETGRIMQESGDTSNLTRDLLLAVFSYIDQECKLRMSLKR